MSYRKFKICEALTPRIARKMKIGWALFELSDLKDLIESAEIPDNACFLEKYNYNLGRDRREVILQNTPEGVVLIVDINQFEGSIYYRQCGQKSVLITIPRYKGKQRNIEFASPYFNLKHKEPDMGIEFDKSKILTAVTADQANEGDLGWVSCTLTGIKAMIERGDAPKEIVRVLPDDYTHRFKTEANAYNLFYPAPYELLQERWVKENGLEVGDTVKIIAGWHRGDKGYKTPMAFNAEGSISKVVKIFDDKIELVTMNVPYFAIEKVKEPEPKYRPFANAEEFKPHHHRLLRRKGEEERYDVVCAFDHEGVSINNEWWIYPCLFDDYVFDDTGEPAGVKVWARRLGSGRRGASRATSWATREGRTPCAHTGF